MAATNEYYMASHNWLSATLVNNKAIYTSKILPSSSMIVTLLVSDLMVIGKQVGISLMDIKNILLPSCSVLLIIFT